MASGLAKHRIRIVNEDGRGVLTRVWLDDREVSASIDRLVVDVDDVVTVTLRMPAVAIEYVGEAAVDVSTSGQILARRTGEDDE